ncbi:YceI family protein [Polyangium fumosum]|uniref:Lipid/polyisoprenoid-binding YceI-like domain-containing protein n=1 Tax=Polyangium fumosum TaxID=889272 RepID=A0A4U1JA92_9BACT|nr:YceI family protein [Polyangium fumosum]TKD03560.1 hypothetical protein E8A74_25505 [Polyangium fumosum]
MSRARPALLRALPFVALVALAASGCSKDEPNPNAAPVSSSLAPAKPKTEAGKPYAVEAQGAKVSFTMDAPIEKIFGEADGSTSGELFVDPEDVTRSTGLLKIDLDKLVIYQQKRADEKAEFGERTKSDLQNEHARDWLGIGKDVAEAERQKRRTIEFKLSKIETAGPKSVAGLTGAERTMKLDVTGDLRLNERTAPKKAELEVTFVMEGDKVAAVRVKSTKPVAVNLDAHDVRPRNALGVILQKTADELTTLGKKVSKDAMVSLDFQAKPK